MTTYNLVIQSVYALAIGVLCGLNYPLGWALLMSQAIIWGVVVAACALGSFSMSKGLWLLVPSLAVVGLCIGTSVTTAFAAGGAVIPAEVHATAFGFLTGASLIGVAISPVLSGLIAARSIRGVFVAGAVVLLILGVIVRRMMVERSPQVESAPVVDES